MCTLYYFVTGLAIQYVVDLIVGLVFVEQIVVIRKGSGYPPVLQILPYHLLIDIYMILLIESDHVRQIQPRPCGHDGLAFNCCFHSVEITALDVKICRDRRMYSAVKSVFLPYLIIRFDVYAF